MSLGTKYSNEVAPVLGAWWRFAWEASCNDVEMRYCDRGHVVLQRSGVRWSMLELFKRLYMKPQELSDVHARNAQLGELHLELND